ncbi:MAG TPA: hypothetical protein VFO91_14315 [Anaerolineales bacterium]|nr:hypothetical protein [Anaerolineales bacterium]
MRTVRHFVAAIVVLALVPASWGSSQAQSAEARYFPETGHTVRGDFLQFYQGAKDPILLYGYPITEQMTSRDGKTVQYFQRARFELRAEQSDGQRVFLTPLGQNSYRPGGQLNIDNSSGCQLFPTGYRVCFAFLDFYNANGGAAQFGNPISPFEFHDHLIVQYFERTRFEWRADRPEGQRVVLTDLGRLYFDQLGEDKAHLSPVEILDATINSVLSIRVRAFVSKPVMPSSGQQAVFIIVQSQTLQAVSGATGRVTIRWPDGNPEEYFFMTNGAGLGSVSFSFSDQEPGSLVPIDIAVTYQGLAGTTKTSFRIWF